MKTDENALAEARAFSQQRENSYRLRTVQTEAQMAPPMLNVAATFAFFFCKPCDARPISCV